jgi:thymidylate synthase (FAD)
MGRTTDLRIIEPSFRLSTPYADPLTEADGIRMLRFIEKQARISHRSEDAQTEDSWKRFIQAIVVSHADWSVCEHATITCTMRVDRGSWLEIRTHGMFGYTAESTRFCNYKKRGGELEFIRPAAFPDDLTHPVNELWSDAMLRTKLAYMEMLEHGIKPQDARSVLPNSLAVTVAQTGNLRAWRHFLSMRTTAETNPELRRTTDLMLKEFQRVVPILFDDLVIGERQIESMKKPR